MGGVRRAWNNMVFLLNLFINERDISLISERNIQFEPLSTRAAAAGRAGQEVAAPTMQYHSFQRNEVTIRRTLSRWRDSHRIDIRAIYPSHILLCTKDALPNAGVSTCVADCYFHRARGRLTNHCRHLPSPR